MMKRAIEGLVITVSTRLSTIRVVRQAEICEILWLPMVRYIHLSEISVNSQNTLQTMLLLEIYSYLCRLGHLLAVPALHANAAH